MDSQEDDGGYRDGDHGVCEDQSVFMGMREGTRTVRTESYPVRYRELLAVIPSIA